MLDHSPNTTATASSGGAASTTTPRADAFASSAAAPKASFATDIWALGVVAYELLLLRRTFLPSMPEKQVRDTILGRLPLPWEQTEPRGLRTLRHGVLACLSRTPEARPSAAAVVDAWSNLLDFAAVKHTDLGT